MTLNNQFNIDSFLFELKGYTDNIIKDPNSQFTSNPIQFQNDRTENKSIFDNSVTTGNIETSLVSKNGKIEATSQSENKGDCWFLSAVNSLNLKQDGQQILSDMFEYHNEGSDEDGYTVVNFAPGDVTVTDKEVAEARNSGKYSSGDDDMIILELAAEKVINNAGEDFAYDDNTPYYVEDLMDGSDKSTIDSGNFEKAMYLLTGKSATAYRENAMLKDGEVIECENGIDKALDLYMNSNSSAQIMNAAVKKEQNLLTPLKDISTGEAVNIETDHQYSVKNIENGVVTISNPWNSGKEIKISIDDFKNTFNQIEYLDLNEANNERSYTSNEYTTDGVNKSFLFNYQDGTSARKTYSNGNLSSVTNFDNNNNVKSKKYFENGKPTYITELNADGTKTIYSFDNKGEYVDRAMQVAKNGTLQSVCVYDETSQQWQPTTMNANDFSAFSTLIKKEQHDTPDTFSIKNNGINNHELIKLDKKGNPDKKSTITLNDNEYNKLCSSGLLKNQTLTTSDLKDLLSKNDSEFNSAVDFINSHPGVKYKDVLKYINK